MRKTILCLAALLTAGASSPALAGKLYIPVLDRNGATTEVWIANGGAADRRYAAFFIPTGVDGSVRPATPPVRTIVLGGRTTRVSGLTTPGQYGLLEIDSAPQLLIDARLRHTIGGVNLFTNVPVISSENDLAANATAHLLGLTRSNAGSSTDLGVVNLASSATSCAVSFFRASGSQIGGTAAIDVPPLSVRTFSDALGLLGEGQAADARAAVSCDQPFYAFAAVFDAATTALSFATPAGTGASALGGGGGTANPPPAGNAVVFTRDGSIHTPASGNEISSFVVPVPSSLSLKRMVIEWDVTPGAFTAGKEDKGHNLIWVHRGKFRSNTIANMNAFGTPRNEVRNNTNVDVPPTGLVTQRAPFIFQQGVTYRVRYVYDAENRLVTVTLSSGGTVLATLNQAATANGRLSIPAAGFFVQFGHTAAQAAEGFELPTYGWNYANLRVEMYQ